MNILIVGWFRFPEGDAESVRLHAIGKALRDSGNNVSYVGMGYHTYMQSYTFDGFEYTTLRKKYKNIIEKFYFYFNYSNNFYIFIYCVFNFYVFQYHPR